VDEGPNVNRSVEQRGLTLVLAAISYTFSLVTADALESDILFGLAAMFCTYAFWPSPPDGEV
jgi:hypothetical protein